MSTAITHTHTTVLRLCRICLGQPGWAGTRRNIHPLLLLVMYDKLVQTYRFSVWTSMHAQHASRTILNFPAD